MARPHLVGASGEAVETASPLSVAYGAPAAATAVSSCVDTVENMVFSELPRFCRATTAATETRAAMRPYSMAVAPDLFVSSFRSFDIISVSLCTLPTTEATP